MIDNIYESTTLLNRLRSKSRPWSGGTQLKTPTTVKNRTSLGSFSGFDTFTTAQEDVRQQFTVNPAEYYANVTISGIQKALNKGPEAIVDLMATEFSDVARNLSELIAEDAYLDGTGNANKDIDGLIVHVDDSTNVTTYQGLSRDTYTNLRSTLTAQGGALALSDLAADYDAAQRGMDSPTLFITTPAVWTIVEALLTPTYNFDFNRKYPTGVSTGGEGGIRGSAGLNAIFYRGVPVISDEKCTAGNIFTLNENHLYLYQIDHDPLFTESSKEGFGWTGWKKSQNQNAIVGQLLFAGQLVGDSPRTMARRTGVTT